MGVFFGFHVVDLVAYRDALSALGRAVDDRALRARLIEQVRAGLAASRHLPWNEQKGSIYEYYDSVVDDFEAHPAVENLDEFGHVAVCAVALPHFQGSPVHGHDASEEALRGSPNFATLGEGDGDLFEVLRRDPRFLPIMAMKHGLEPYRVGSATSLLTRDEVRDLRNIAASAAATGAALDDVRERARDKLQRVMETALADERYGVLYSDYE